MLKRHLNIVVSACLALSLTFLGCTQAEEVDKTEDSTEPVCTTLFDGETLNGWSQLGNAPITIEDHVIVGRGVQEPVNTYLRTNKEYSDFDLTLEFKIDSLFNSGIQIRGAVAEERMTFDHQAGNGDRFERVTEPGRVFGIQAEIDGTSRGWTAQIYEEEGRGWLETFEKEIVPLVLNHSEWNRYRIRVVGDSISTWINDKSVATIANVGGRSSGFVALQVHSIRRAEDATLAVRFRDIQICDF